MGKKRKYRLVAGQRSANWRTGIEEYDGNSRDTSLNFTTLKDLKEAARLAGLISYQVYINDRYGHGRDSVYETPDVVAFHQSKEEERNQFNKDQEEKAKLINQLPKKMEIEGLDIRDRKDLKAYIVPSEAYYKSSLSRSIQVYFEYHFELAGKPLIEENRFNPSGFFTKGGAFQWKQFKATKCSDPTNWNPFGKLLDHLEKGEIKELLQKLIQERNKIKRVIQNIEELKSLVEYYKSK